MHDERWQRLVTAAKNGAKDELRYQVDTLINQSPLTGIYTDPNPTANLASGSEYEDRPYAASEEGDLESFHFDDKENNNRAAAAAAYRMLGGTGDIVAYHDLTKGAFFGTPTQLEEFIGHRRDLDDENWTIYQEADEILDLDYDQVTMKEILHRLNDDKDAEKLANAEELFEKFHWGDKSKTIGIKNVPGVAGPLTFLGVGREIHYGSKKDGKWVEYFHEFGEESKTFPAVYALGTDVLVIHGGKMTIEADGIRD